MHSERVSWTLMSNQKWPINLVMTLTVLGLSGQMRPAEPAGAETKSDRDGGKEIIPAKEGAASYRIANRHILRTMELSDGRLVTKEIGSPGNPIPVTRGDEFALIIGPDRKRITARDFRVASVEPAEGSLSVVLQNQVTGLTAQAGYRLANDDFYVRKTISFRNDGKSPVQILDVEVENLRFRKARALGFGKPVYAEGRLFLGLEFPLSQNRQNDGLVTLGHLPGRTLQPGDSLVTKTAVVGTASRKETVEEAFDRYVRRIALRKP
jgi:hypothetical protein